MSSSGVSLAGLMPIWMGITVGRMWRGGVIGYSGLAPIGRGWAVTEIQRCWLLSKTGIAFKIHAAQVKVDLSQKNYQKLIFIHYLRREAASLLRSSC